MFNVLVVCTGNICRSPMAEGLLRESLTVKLRKKVTVSSAGTHGLQGYAASENALHVMREFGVDIEGHRARTITAPMIRDADLVLVMEEVHASIIGDVFAGAQNRTHNLAEFSSRPELLEIRDPYGESVEAYREIASMIYECIEGVTSYITKNLIQGS